MLFTPGGLPATLIIKGYESKLEAWWKTLGNPTERADLAIGAVLGYAQLFDDKK